MTVELMKKIVLRKSQELSNESADDCDADDCDANDCDVHNSSLAQEEEDQLDGTPEEKLAVSVRGQSALKLKLSSGFTEVPISEALNDDNNNAPEVSN